MEQKRFMEIVSKAYTDYHKPKHEAHSGDDPILDVMGVGWSFCMFWRKAMRLFLVFWRQKESPPAYIRDQLYDALVYLIMLIEKWEAGKVEEDPELERILKKLDEVMNEEDPNKRQKIFDEIGGMERERVIRLRREEERRGGSGMGSFEGG